MAFNRELSQFAAYLELDAAGKYIGITPAESTTNVGIGVTNPGSKLSVVGDANITGVVTATQFYGNLDYSYVLNATAGIRTEFSVVDNGGDGSLSYDSQTGIISYVGPSSAEARAHFSATSSDFGSLVYNSETGVFAYTGVTTSNIHDQFSATSADIGSLSYDSQTGEFSLSGVTTSAIRDQFSGGTGVTISNGEVAIGQPVGTSDGVTFASVNSTGIVTATQFVTGASGEAIGINTNTISGPETLILDPAAVGDDTGKVVIKGDLQVDGTQTIINSTTVTVEDKNIQIADGAANDAAADGAGITVNSGDGDKTFQFNDASDAFKSNISLDVASGEAYKVNGTEVLSSDTLGSSVVNSSLTSVGTLGKLDVGNINSTGIVTATSGFDGDLTGNVTGDLTGNADTATTLETPRSFEITGDVVASAINFDGSGNVSFAATIQPNSVALGDDTTGNYVATIADSGNTNITVNNSGTENADVTLDLTDTTVSAGSYGSSSEIPTFTVDAKGRLTAAGTVSVSTGMTVAGDSGSEVIDLLSETLTIAGGTNLTSSAASDTVTVNLDDNISLTSVSASGIITATSGFDGDLTGDVTGNLTGEVNATAFDTNESGVVVTGIATATGFDGDLTGNVTGNVTGDLTGNADTATALETARDFSISGDATASAVSFDGTANVGLALTLADTAVSAGSYGSSTEIPTFTVDSKGRLTAAGTASVGTALTVSGDSGSEVIDLLSESLTIAGGTNLTSSAASDTVTVNLDSDISLDSVTATGIITATGGFDGDLTGNADTATALETARTFEITGDIVGSPVSFDGTGNVSIAATIQPNSVALGDDTTGNYVATIADSGDSDVVVNNSGTETAGVTLGLTTTGVSAGSYGSSTEIPTFTVDSRGRLTAAGTAAVGTALTVAGDSGSELINLLSETLTIAGGTNLTSSAASDTVTIDLDNDINVSTVNASGIVTAAQFVTGASGEAIGINTNTISGPETLILDPAAVGDNTGTVVIKGDLQVDGTQTIINSTTVTVEDKNIQIADGAANDAAADGAGITVNSGDGDKTFQFSDANDSFQSNIALDVTSGNVYKIDGTEVLSSDTLGSGVVNSSLTSVGTLGQLNVTGVTTSTGGFVGDLTGDVTGNADTATALETPRSFEITGDVVASAISFDGTGNVSFAATIQPNSVALGDDTTGNYVATIADAGNTNISVNNSGTETAAVTLDLTDTTVSAGSYGSSTEIPTFTVDAKGRLTAAGTASVGTALTVAGDSGSEVIDLLDETLTIAGGTNLTSSAASDTVTINLNSDISLDSVTATGIITATGGFDGDLTGDVTGNADTATALETARDFSISGDATASAVSFDGTANVGLALTLADTTVSAGSYGSSTEIPTFTVDSKGRLTAAGTASVGTAMTVAGDSGSEVIDLLTESLTIAGGTNLTSSAASDTVTVNLDSDINLDSVTATGIITATGGFDGDLTGDVTGNVTGNLNSSGLSTVTNLEVGGYISAGSTTGANEQVMMSTGVGVTWTTITDILPQTRTGFTTTASDGQTAFSFEYNVNYLDVFVNGVKLSNSDFSASNGSDITLTEATFSGDRVEFISYNTAGTGVGSVNSLNDLSDVSIGALSSGNILSYNGSEWQNTSTLSGITALDATTTSTIENAVANAPNDFSSLSISGVSTFSGAVDANGGADISGGLSVDSINASGIVTATGGFSGDLTGNVTGDVTGNADTATALETGRDFSISGDATASPVSFDGTSNVGLALTLADTAVTPGSYGSASEIPTFTVDSKGRLTAAGTVNVSTGMTVAADSGTETINLLNETLTIAGGTNLTSSAASDTVTINLDDNISLSNVNASGIITAAQFVTGASGEAIGINTNTISGPATLTIDPAAVGDNTGLVVIKGDLQIDGTTTTVNSTTVTVDDKNITLASGAANDAAADGGGITVESGDGDKTFTWVNSTDAWTSSEDMNLVSGKVYEINGSTVLSANTLGSGVVNSSLTSVGTLTNLSVGDVSSTGIVTATGGFSGDLTGNVTGDVTGNSDTASALETARTISLTGDVVGAVSFDGSSNVSIAATIQPNSVALGDDTTGNYVATIADAGNTNITVNNSGTETAAVTLDLTDTTVSAGSYGSSTEIPTFTVDAKGRLTAAGTAAVGTALTVAGDSGSELINLLSETLTIAGGTNLTSSAASDTVTINLDSNISLDSVTATGIITATGGFSGDLTGNVTGDVTGNADTATALETARTFEITGDVVGSAVSFDGTGNVSIAATIQPNSVALGDDTTGNYVATIADAGNTNITVNNSGSETAAVTLDLTDTTVSAGSYGSSTEIPTFTVDAKGRLTAAGTAAVGTALTVAGDSGSEVIDLLSETLTIAGGTNLTSSAASDTVTVNLNSDISLDSVTATGIITATGGFSGDLTGNVTGDVTGNADTATTLETPRNIGGVSFDGSANIDLPGVNTSGNQDTSGNAATATALETSRTISLTGDVAGAVSFDGSSNVSIAATIQPNSVALGDDTTGNYVATIADAGNTNITVNNSGTENAGVTLDLTDTTVSAGSYGSSTEIPTFTVDAKGRLTAAGTAAVSTGMTVAGDSGSETIDLLSEQLTIAGDTHVTTAAASDTVTISVDATSENTNNTIVARDSSGGFSAGIITASQVLLGAEGSALQMKSDRITGPATIILDPAAVGDDTGVVVIKGDLQVDGTQTIINSTTVTVNDKNIQIADGAANDAAADGAGLTVNSGDGNKTFQFVDANDSFQSNIALDVTSGNVYKIDGTEVLSSDTLGSGVVNSSLTSVGTLNNLNVSGVSTFSSDVDVNASVDISSNLKVAGVTTSTGGFVGDLTGDVTGNAATATTLQTSRTIGGVSFDGSANINLPGVNTSGNQDTSGNAATATALETGRTIGGVSFDGTANIDLPGVNTTGNQDTTGTATNATNFDVAADDSTNATHYLIFTGGATGNQRPNSDTSLTYNPSSNTLNAGSFNSTSDRNLKENIRPVENASELVGKLEGVHFTWKENGDASVGVIAQQIEEHLPQLIYNGDDHKSVNYNGLVGVLIEAVKEQGQMISALQAEIKELKK